MKLLPSRRSQSGVWQEGVEPEAEVGIAVCPGSAVSGCSLAMVHKAFTQGGFIFPRRERETLGRCQVAFILGPGRNLFSEKEANLSTNEER